ncbi:ATP-binding protein [Streptomyces sp. NPDC001601]|uniref:ATP-binding protein n=1 Tax=Streptomyces sp. NPDC001601 TaxID=3364592 RepID=UPI00369BC62E
MTTTTSTYTRTVSQRRGVTRRPRQAAGGAWRLAHRPESAGEARRITRVLLTRWGVPQAAADSVLLTVSELVTNAVEHAQPPLNLSLNRDADTRRVHIEVSDGGPADREGDWAAGGTPDEHGRGLDIIDHITAAHGEHDHPGHAVHWADVNATA